ncbi:MAG: DUF1440 domain-containing protein [Chitinophagaceae bacterium]|nr:DUF1440 domain-containing protein [Chitinophagaceae bacterium]
MKVPFKPILFAWIIAGTADAAAAVIVYSFVLDQASPLKIFQGIASGIAGKSAFEGGAGSALTGLALHYCIALCWVIIYFFLYPKIKLLQKNKIVSGLFYGLFVWLVMNIIVLPVTFNRPPALLLHNFLTGSIILMIAIGLPVSIIADNYFNKQRQ